MVKIFNLFRLYLVVKGSVDLDYEVSINDMETI